MSCGIINVLRYEKWYTYKISKHLTYEPKGFSDRSLFSKPYSMLFTVFIYEVEYSHAVTKSEIFLRVFKLEKSEINSPIKDVQIGYITLKLNTLPIIYTV